MKKNIFVSFYTEHFHSLFFKESVMVGLWREKREIHTIHRYNNN